MADLQIKSRICIGEHNLFNTPTNTLHLQNNIMHRIVIHMKKLVPLLSEKDLWAFV